MNGWADGPADAAGAAAAGPASREGDAAPPLTIGTGWRGSTAVPTCARTFALANNGREATMAQQQTRFVNALDKLDPVWARVRREADEVVRREPELASFIYSSLLHHDTLEGAIVHRVAARLDHPDVSGELIRQAYADALKDDAAIGAAFRADIVATIDRDPASDRYLDPVLYFKGFHAIQTHRLAHWLWGKGRKDFAFYLQSRSSAVFQTDINPAARIGRGIFLDHATGLVVGETAVIEDDVSMLQDVTLGGTGKEDGNRHPTIRRGVLIGAGAKILGNIEVGECARIAAGSVVLKAVPAHMTVAGVPARVVGEAGCAEPARAMDQMLHDVGL
jgi:serine O-acetyltransferase